jgi:hypothetical protein
MLWLGSGTSIKSGWVKLVLWIEYNILLIIIYFFDNDK